MSPKYVAKPVCAAAVDIIKEFEGCRLTAYRCSGGKPTIGWGSCRGIKESDIGKLTISQASADARLVEDVAHAAELVDAAVLVPLNDNQRGALTSIMFNVGPGCKGVKDGIITLKSGEQSTLLKRLNEGNYAACAEQFGRWIYADGKKLNGLIRRRAAEKALFLTPAGQEPAMTTAPIPKPVPSVSEVGSGAKVSLLAGAPAAWLIASLWNALLPENPMPIEVASGLGAFISTGFYLLGDYLSRQKEPQL